MEAKKNINQMIDETLESVSRIDTVDTPPFFKDKVLRRLDKQEEKETEGIMYLDWFTPKFQAAALVCFVLLNLGVLLNSSTDNYEENLTSFAQTYGLSETGANSYFAEN